MKKDFATWREEIMCGRNRQAQEALIMELFRYQAKHNALYSSYLSHVGRKAEKSKGMEDIVYLPLQFFRSHEVKTGDWKEERRFLSSGTTDSQRSAHAIDDISFYVHHAQRIFERHYGLLKELCLIVYLPNYEHSTSSLICMLKHFVSCAHTLSGFVSNADMLADKVDALSRSYKGNKVLWGVTFALLEASRVLKGLDLSDYLLIETGGMKREETVLRREDMHCYWKECWNCRAIHTEYGMTEMLSQAYGASGQMAFSEVMRICVREREDPFSLASLGSVGGINVIDLANVHSCAFLQTEDLGRVHENGTFEVIGRESRAEQRGCHQLFEEYL